MRSMLNVETKLTLKRKKQERNLKKKVAHECKTNPKAFWKYANSRIKSKTGINKLLKEDGTLAETDESKANVLNDFFSKVFQTENSDTVPVLKEGE